MTILKNENQWDKSNVLFREGLVVKYNKHQPRFEMAYIDYGLGVLSASVFAESLNTDSFDLAHQGLKETTEFLKINNTAPSVFNDRAFES